MKRIRASRTVSRRRRIDPSAAQLAPDFPVNRLNLVESFLLWGEKSEARLHLKKLEALLPAARTNLAGAEWAADWADWEQRIAKARRALQD